MKFSFLALLPQALVLPADTDLITAQDSQQLSQPENKFLKGSDGLISLSNPRPSRYRRYAIHVEQKLGEEPMVGLAYWWRS